MNYRLFSRFPLALPSLFAALAVSLAALPGSLGAVEVNATFSSAATVPVTAASYTATGNTVDIALNFAPPAGTNLTVVKITSPGFIDGRFGNLAQGQRVDLTFGGVNYPFVANYYGGTGNDLELQWGNVRLMAWGRNAGGVLGIDDTANMNVPVAVEMRGALAGKTVTAVSAGAYHGLALCSDGTLAAWGENTRGQLGNNGGGGGAVPVAVDRSGVLAGKTVMAIAAGNSHSLALCGDGTLAAWGSNSWGELGVEDGGGSNQVPQAVKTSGVLAGKSVIAIGAGYGFSVALCADGTVAAWGANVLGELGNNSTANSREPVAVDRDGVLRRRTVTAISVGGDHCLAFCADGAIAAWGANGDGQLGNGTTTDSMVPVLVSWPGGLSGKVVSAIAAGRSHSLALCSDGTLVAWGSNGDGELGNGNTAKSSVPVAVNQTGVLSGRAIRSLCPGAMHSMAVCADGSLATWGSNYYGQLGNGSFSDRTVPVLVNTSALRTGERFVPGFASPHPLCSYAVVASPPPPVATTLAASGITDTGVTLNATVDPNGQSTVVGFEYGLTTDYGATAAPTPATLTGTTTRELAVTLSNLASRSTYHYRVVATSPGGTLYGEDMTFATSDIASLAGLSLSAGTLSPGFDSLTTSYSAVMPYATSSITVTPVAEDALATIRVQGVTVASGQASAPVPLAVGNTTITLVVTPPGAAFSKTYTVMVTRSPETYVFNSPTTVPVTTAAFDATGRVIAFSLGFAPPAGTNLTVVDNTGPDLIQGEFANLTQGQQVELTYNGVVYPFLANYFGGTGNDLVLQWGNTRLLTWGDNSYAKLGQDHTSQCLVPTPVLVAGALAGRQILDIAVGEHHCLAICADGSLVGWGRNASGELGDNSTINRALPVEVDQTGVLAGKRVVALSAGSNFSLALCDDGTLAAWGVNDYRQLGDGTTTNRMVPVLVNMDSGGFAGKKVTAVAAGGRHSVAHCTDGTLVAWGYGDYGQLGNGTNSYTSPPVIVTKGAVLSGKTLVGLAVGFNHNMVLCSDGTLAAWGSNGWGAVGNNSAANAATPVAVVKTGVLSGKTITAIAAEGNNSLVRCSDNTLATWGDNTNGRLGNGSTTYSKVPVAVTRTGVLYRKTIVEASPWAAVCSDGALATWGDNTYGQLGNNSTTHSTTPVLAITTALRSGEKIVAVHSGGYFNLAVVAAPPAPTGTTLAATGISDNTCTVAGTANANGQSATVSFEYGLTAGYGWSVAGTPSPVTGTSPVGVSAVLTGLLPGQTYHFRVVVASGGGGAYGEDQEFTTTAQATLVGLVPNVGTLVPALDPAVSSYSMCVLPTTVAITLAPTVAQQGATVTVAGTPVTSGTASGPLAVAVGNTVIPVVVTAADGVTTMTYTVTVTRPPEVLVFNTAAYVPVTAAAFDASGMTAAFALGFAPPPGTILTVVNQTGLEFIRGTFGNLAQGQEVALAYAGVRYRFIVNYFGGTGNDLVLQWANVRLMAWGSNSSGQIGNGGQLWNGSGYTNRNLLVPTAVDASGVLAGKTVMAAAVGGNSSLALCADGTLAAWGEGGGKLGNGTTLGAVVPVLVDRSGVLADKTVAAMAVGAEHCLVLCADGTLVTWGDNDYGQLGNNSTTASSVPVLVDMSGVLVDKKVMKISTTGNHNLVLCADGTLAAWGANNWTGQLGNNSTIDSSVPVLVETCGVLHGRRVVEIAAGGGHSAALCADGTLALWGRNDYGQLGLGNKTDSKVPVALPMTGVLAGKTIRSVSASYYHTMAWCADGTLAAWGDNDYGALGNNTTTDSLVPVAVVRSGVLTGKTITGITTGGGSGGALCADGSIATWGANPSGQLGNNSITNTSVPVLVDMTGMGSGARFLQGPMCKIDNHTLALVGSVPEPSAVLTLAATATHDQGTTLNGSVNANGSATTVTFEYGLTTDYGAVVSATPATVTGTTATPVSAVLSGLPTGTTFHYRVIAESAGGVVKGEDLLVTTTDQATLAGLAVSAGTLDPGFAPVTTAYALTVPTAAATLTVTPVASHADAAITVNGQPVASGAASEPVALVEGNNVITVGVTSGAGADTGSYTLRVLRVPSLFRFTAAGTVGIAVSSLRPAGAELRFELGFAPLPGCVLTVVDNTGPAMIDGVFDNLAHGQRVELSFGGAAYPFVANYYGGTGNDLVLQWAATKLFSWGYDSNGELGDNSTGSGISQLPVAVYTAGVLAGKTVMAVSVGSYNAVALCADGTLASWGYGYNGRLGNGGNWYDNAGAPVAVNMTGVLAGKKVVAVAVGGSNTLALCADGTLATWGENTYGQLGDGTTTNRTTPVLVDRSGVLAGRAVTAIACGQSHSLVLCADGSLAAWGVGSHGQLGNGGTAQAKVPVAVTMTGVLAGKTVTAIAAGDSLSFALCADGTVAAWGRGDVGQLGNGTNSNSSVPVLVNRTGVLAGKTVTALAAGSGFGVVRCADGTLAAWGTGALLGAGGIANSNVPVLVNRSGVLAGKTVTSLAAGSAHTLVGCSDGSAAAWGSDSNGQLGDSTAGSSVTAPVAVATSTLPVGARFMTVNGGGGERTSVAMVALPPPPSAATLAATAVLDAGATLNASVQPNGVSTAVSFEYGPTTAYGTTVQASPATVTGTGSKSASYVLDGLTPGATYHFRVVLVTGSGTFKGNDMTVTTTTLGTLAGLTVVPGSVFPAFDSTRNDYTVTVPHAADSLRVTPVTAYADAAVTVNGVATASGSASEPVALVPGNTTIPVVVTSGDGNNVKTYQIVVTRLPETFAWPAASAVPVTATDFLAAGDAPSLSLGHAPQPGASLMVVNNTGAGPIRGSFGNLVDGQRVELEFSGITYVYFVNYSGGTGNDLVLEWGNNRLMSWGLILQGQVGGAPTVDIKIPTALPSAGALAGKTIRDVRCGSSHSLVLCWDGSLAAWGGNSQGQLGSGTLDDSAIPVAVVASGALAGKTVVAIASGSAHNLVLCSDGTLAAWPYSANGSTTSWAPVLVPMEGALAGKQVISAAVGEDFDAVLCSDGSVFQWGRLFGYDGYVNEDLFSSSVPVSIQELGALAGKNVVALRAGFRNCLALCSDGTLVAWGANSSGTLGNGSSGASSTRYEPVAVTMTGALSGKTIKEMAVGAGACLVLCSDGTLVSWGNNYYGQLGIGNKTDSLVPVVVNQTGVLSGRQVAKVFAGQSQFYALCSDGTMVAWGYNYYGGLGTGDKTDSMVPVLVNSENLAEGERFAWSGGAGSAHNRAVAIVAMPPAPQTATLAATAVTDTGATLNAEVRPNGRSTQVTFEYGRTTAYGTRVAVTPLSGTGTQSANLPVTELSPGVTYHFRVIASTSSGTATGADLTFTTSTLATLAGLGTSVGELNPGFAAGQQAYSITVPPGVQAVALTPVVANPGATVKVNGVTVTPGGASAEISLAIGATVIPVEVTSQDGGSVVTYTITVDRVPEGFVFGADSGAGLRAAGFVAAGCTAEFELAYAPPVGSQLTVIDNTGIGFIRGTFDNLHQGEQVVLDYDGISYVFVANYFGGTGNDLVLQWANTRLMGWGSNSNGQLGDNSTTNRTDPVAVTGDGVLAGRSIIAVACGSSHTLAVCADGTVAAWGSNTYGQLGNNSTTKSPVPVAVDLSGELAGKTVVAVAAGSSHSLALCSDGTLAGWGLNTNGQLGNVGVQLSSVPVVIERLGVLAGKEIVAIAAGSSFNLALTADGLLAAWGGNAAGQLGDGGTTTRLEPVAVGENSVLSGRRVKAIAAGGSHSLALCADGTLVGWGYNNAGQVGDGSTTTRLLPVKVPAAGALAGRQIARIAAGGMHSLAWCTDGVLAAWGYNSRGELGTGSTTNQAETVPLQVITSGALAGKQIRREVATDSSSAAICTDGTLVAWGGTPTAVSTAGLAAGERFADCFGSRGTHVMATVARPVLAIATTLAATAVGETSATLNAEVSGNGGAASVSFEYGPTASYGSSVAAVPASVTGTGGVAVAAELAGLRGGTLYHFRVRVTNAFGSERGSEVTFTTGNRAGLAALALGAGSLAPAFDASQLDYSATVPFGTDATTVTAVAAETGAVIEIAGNPVTSGTASSPVPLAPGVTAIPVRVTAADGSTTRTYTVTVARVPQAVVWDSAEKVPLRVERFTAAGAGPDLVLGFVPVPGTRLPLVEVTDTHFISGEFANLPQGARVELVYSGFSYPFVVNYYSGSGNDLALEWANVKVLAWGYNNQGQLGNNTVNQSYTPVDVSAHGALVGRIPAAISAAGQRALALDMEGTPLAWGGAWNSSTYSGSPTVPVVVEALGALAGRRVVSVAAGASHSLALCMDGTVAAWGTGTSGQLGGGGFVSSTVPVAVDRSGVLAGKQVVSLAAGSACSYALCADGTVAAWGSNEASALGPQAGGASAVPVQVSGGALSGRKPVALAAGSGHCLALGADGAVVAWGANSKGQLGNNSVMNSAEPVLVDTSGVLAGKRVTALAAGSGFSVALCADGTLATWGGSEAAMRVPVEVNRAGVLDGKMVVGLSSTAATSSTVLAVCADGSMVGWGLASHGQLGLSNTYSVSYTAPVGVAAAITQAGARLIAASAGDTFTLALAAYPISGRASTLPATALHDSGATLHGAVQPGGGTVAVSFEYGLTESYGSTVEAQPTGFAGMDETAVSAPVTGLLAGTPYHYRVVATAGTWVARGEDRTFTPTSVGALAALTPNAGVLAPDFAPGVSDYALTVPAPATSVTLTPVAGQPGATITFNGAVVASGLPCPPLDLTSGSGFATITVDAGDGVNSRTYRVTVTRLPAVFAFDAPSTVPATAGRFGVVGMAAMLELRHAPVPGASLTVLRSTGGEPIHGNFANLAHGQIVLLEYQGLVYRFVANYYGGKGNDLVLQWADRRVFGWGRNDMGQLPGRTGTQMEAAELNLRAVLAGRTILDAAAGASHMLLLLDNGTIASWGSNSNGQTGHGGSGPAIVDRTGVLAGKTVVQIAAGMQHNLALCSDGTLVAWGNNGSGALGDGTSTQRSRPVAVPRVGALADRRPLALAAGASCSLVLCTDGTLVAWGANSSGQLGNGSTTSSAVPVEVDMSGVLNSKEIRSLALANGTCFALCADGTLAGWGSNQYGMIGDNTTDNRSTPVRIDDKGALAGKTVATVAAGYRHNHALCTDGTLVAWGYDQVGHLGDGGTLYGTQSPVPVLVDRSGVLADKTVTKVAAGDGVAGCLTSDGNLFFWGTNDSGILGIGSSSPSGHSSPVAVSRANLSADQRFIDIVCSKGWGGSYAFVDGPLAPVAETLAATPVGDASATLRGVARPNDADVTISFEYGLTSAYGAMLDATPTAAFGTAEVAASADLTGLLPGATYHFRMLVTAGPVTVAGGDLTFTTGTGAALAGLTLSEGILNPPFAMANLAYGAVVSAGTERVTVTPVAAAAGATVRVNGTPVASGMASAPVELAVGNNPLVIAVTAAAGGATTTYQVTITRLPEVFRFDSPATVPVTVDGFTATGRTVSFELGFAPPPGTRLTALRNIGGTLIGGVFDNLAQGELVTLDYGGRSYRFAANYRGGTGNDLVLEWAAGRVLRWGGGTTVPSALDIEGILHGGTVVQVAASSAHRLVLMADGSLYGMGSGSSGRLGTGGTYEVKTPLRLNDFGALAGRAVVAVAAGEAHGLALCADGTLTAWGTNGNRQLGIGDNNDQQNLPVEVDRSGVLAGRRIVALAASSYSSYALCEDGVIAAWGTAYLGNGSTGESARPVLVDTSGVLAGKRVVSLAVGSSRVVALCDDGFLAAWGSNSYGALGNGSTTLSTVPVAVDRSGVLAGKTVVSVAAAGLHTLVLCSDGSLAAWGAAPTGTSDVPVIVNPVGVLEGRTVVGIAAGEYHGMALCSDGTVAAWGSNGDGQLGNGTTTSSSVPVASSMENLVPGERVTALVSSPFGSNSAIHALTALPDWLEAITLPASPVAGRNAMVRGWIETGGLAVDGFFDYGPTADYGLSAAANPASLTGGAAEVESLLTGLAPATTYHYRVRCATPLGTILGEDMQFTTATVTTLADLHLSQGVLGPAFAAAITRYVASVPATVDAVALTPVAANSGATIEINGSPVASGSASAAIPLTAGTNTITVKVTSPDGGEVLEYTVVVTRLPERLVFGSAADVALSTEGFTGSGISPVIVLGFEPSPGVELTLIRNTGDEPVRGTFSGLAQGQSVLLDYAGASYRFVASYYGGSGNDLVLRWANTRVVGWGSNSEGQLGNGLALDSAVPTVAGFGGLTGKPTLATVVGGGYGLAGGGYGLALGADGLLEAAGSNSHGKLGNGTTTDSLVPVAVDRSGVLAGKTVVSMATGYNFVLAVAADGTVASWGYGQSGELGHGIEGNSQVPVAVDRSGVLAGKRVTALAGGEYHALALCNDGMIAAWGYNGAGSLGLGTTASTYETRPLRVATDGVLAGKPVAAIAAGRAHSVALCRDGTLVAWGTNDQGQVGDNSTTSRNAPVAVDASGVLAGRTVVAITSGMQHSLALCADGTLVAWGSNGSGQLGNNTTTNSPVPVRVDQSGVLAGKTIVSLAAGSAHSMVLCSDGSVIGWGSNSVGQLGNMISGNQLVPAAAVIDTLAPGERTISLSGAFSTNLAVVAMPGSTAVSGGAAAITGTSATLHGGVNARNNAATVSFEYGLTETYGGLVVALPAAVYGRKDTAVAAALHGLLPGTIYHYRVVAESWAGIVRGADRTFTTLSDNALLAELGHDGGAVGPALEPDRFEFWSSVPFETAAVVVSAATEHPHATFTVNGVDQATPVALAVGNNPITITVTAEDGETVKTYTLIVNRLPQEFVFDSATDVPVTADGFAAGDFPVVIRLGYAPTPGTVLTMVNNAGLGFIHGTFGNLAQGQRVTLNYGGRNYHFVTNYYGGTGNDLVLQWAATEVLAWGAGKYGQLGNDDTTDRLLPTSVAHTGVLSGKTITAVSCGYLHSLALFSDGTLATWGYNVYGQLGNRGTDQSRVPVAVDRSGALVGKTVIAISAGPFHNLALCTDGSIVAWGYNNYGQLGNGDTQTSRVPVGVAPIGALAGKHVVAVAAAVYHSFALCDDGTVAGWGYNDDGELGDGTTTGTSVPVAVDMTGALAGKRISAISAGQYHTLALCTDGTLAAWGYNQRGQLGDGTTTTSAVPVVIGSNGVLAGKTVTAIRASSAHSLALCADGTLAAWGYNHRGQLGTGDAVQSNIPMAADLSGIEPGKVVAGLGGGLNHNLLRFSDGSLAAWGDNTNGQLGDNSTTRRATAGLVDVGGQFVMMAGGGSAASHNLAVVALPELDAVTAALWYQGIGTGGGLSGDELIRYAFGLAAGEVISGQLPQPQRIGDDLVIRFVQPAGVTGLTYGAEWSETLEAGSWIAIPDTGSGGEHLFSLPVGAAPRLFIRLKVSER